MNRTHRPCMHTDEIPLNRLYDDLAWLWPLLSPPAGYAEEAACWRALLRRELGAGRHAILELGAGGGHNLSHLTADFEATAVDRSEPMLALSRQLNPGVAHVAGDMRTIRLPRLFKAVLIHDAISHITAAADLEAVFRTAAAHLEPGGVVVAAPDWLRETFINPWTAEVSHCDDELRLTTFEYVYDPDPDDTVIETVMTHFIERAGRLTIEYDRLQLGLFPQAVWKRSVEAAGLTFARRRIPLADVEVPSFFMIGRKAAAATRAPDRRASHLKADSSAAHSGETT
jgi:ubiquinone/menaquinone biosynthesis C-methylase UbiE